MNERRIWVGLVVLLAILTALALSACSASPPHTSAPPQPQHTSVARQQAAIVTPESMLSDLESAGVACPVLPTPRGIACTYKAYEYTVAGQTLEQPPQPIDVTAGSLGGSAKLRRKACDEGYVPASMKVVSTGDLVLVIDSGQPAGLDRLAKALNGQLEAYCP